MSRIAGKEGSRKAEREPSSGNLNGSIAPRGEGKKTGVKDSALSLPLPLEKKGTLGKSSRTRMAKGESFRESIKESFRAKISELNKSKEPKEDDVTSPGGGVTFAHGDEKRKRPPRTLSAFSPDRIRRASRGPAINPFEMVAAYRAKENVYAATYKNSFLCPYNWIPAEETKVDSSQSSPLTNGLALGGSTSSTTTTTTTTGSSSPGSGSAPLQQSQSQGTSISTGSLPNAETNAGSFPITSLFDRHSPSPRPPSMELTHAIVEGYHSPKASPSRHTEEKHTTTPALSLATSASGTTPAPSLSSLPSKWRLSTALVQGPPLPTMESMFENIDIKFEGYQKWVQDMQAKVEERKKKKPAGGDQRALLRTPSVRAFLPSLGTSSSTPTSQAQPQSPQHTNSSTSPSPAAATSASGSNAQSSQPPPALTRRNTPTNAAMMAASLSTSLGLQKFTECTELERSFTRLKLTINPLFLMRKKLQLAQELQQQQEANPVPRPPPAYPPPPPPATATVTRRSSLGTLSLMNQNHGSSSSLLNGTGSGIQPIPHNPSPLILPSPHPPSSGAAPSSTTSTPAQPT